MNNYTYAACAETVTLAPSIFLEEKQQQPKKSAVPAMFDWQAIETKASQVKTPVFNLSKFARK